MTESSPSARPAGPVPGDPSARRPASLIAGRPRGNPASGHAAEADPGEAPWQAGQSAATYDREGEAARTGVAGDELQPGPSPGAGQPRPRAARWLGWLEQVPVPRPGFGGRLGRRAAVAGLGVVAAGGLAVAVIAAGQARAELDRGPTAAERSAAAATALALRWRTWPAGQIFPARLRYGPPGARTRPRCGWGSPRKPAARPGSTRWPGPPRPAGAARPCSGPPTPTGCRGSSGPSAWSRSAGPATRPRSSARWPAPSPWPADRRRVSRTPANHGPGRYGTATCARCRRCAPRSARW